MSEGSTSLLARCYDSPLKRRLTPKRLSSPLLVTYRALYSTELFDLTKSMDLGVRDYRDFSHFFMEKDTSSLHAEETIKCATTLYRTLD